MAIVLAIVALTFAAVAIGEGIGAGLAGHDYSGLLLLPAGVALLVLAPVLLWRSRRTDGPRVRRYARRALVALVGAFAAFWLLFPLALGVFITHRPRVEVKAAKLGRPHEDVTLRTSDGLDLAGWYVPSENRAAVIVFPGRTSRVPHARMLARNGYGILMLDMRGQGESDGDPNVFGWDSPKDLDAAIAFLEARPDVDEGKIGGIGFSVGGEQMIQAGAENDALNAVISEGAGERSIHEATMRGPAGWPALIGQAVADGVIAVVSGDAPPSSLGDLVARVAPTPLFLIYATHGQGGEDLNPEYFRAAREPKELWEMRTGGHTDGLETEGEEYERRVVEFFADTLLR